MNWQAEYRALRHGADRRRNERTGHGDLHLNAKVISRGKGQSAIAAAAYRSGERLRDEQANEQKFYTSRAERIQFTALMVPKDAPEWARDRNQLWNAAERAEKRKDAQLAREIEISLPHELTAQQREWLVKDFAREAFVRHGYPVDIAIHAPDKESNWRNHHAHLMVTMRTLGPEGFAAKKDRDLNSKAQLGQWREQWAHLANRHLERHGHAARIDHRSLREQGVDREPTVHVGYAGNEIARRGAQSDRMDALRDVLDRNEIRVDLKALDRELQGLEETQRRQVQAEGAKIAVQAQEAARAAEIARAAAVAQQKLQKAARADERALHTSVARAYGDGAREAAQELRQERKDATFWAQQDAWKKDVAENSPKPGAGRPPDSGGIRVVDGATGVVSRLGDFMVGLLAGASPAPENKRPADMKAFVNDPAARKEQQLARLAAVREAQADARAVEHMRQDMEAGKGLRAEDIRALTPAHQMQLMSHGDDGVRQIIEEARRSRSRDEGRERDA